MSTRQTVLAIGALLALGGTAPADDDRVATKLKELGAHVRRDETKPGRPIVSVAVLGISERKLTDADLKELAPLDHLRTLSLVYTMITDAGLKHLATYPQLDYLSLFDSAITDAGLEHVAALKQLRELSLWQTKVTDSG